MTLKSSSSEVDVDDMSSDTTPKDTRVDHCAGSGTMTELRPPTIAAPLFSAAS